MAQRSAEHMSPSTVRVGVDLVRIADVATPSRSSGSGTPNDAIIDDGDAILSMGFALRMNGLTVQSAEDS